MLSSFMKGGFQLVFKNGWTASVMFGAGNYCDNRYTTPHFSTAPEDLLLKYDSIRSENAEIAAWNKDDGWLSFGHDQVEGHVEADDVMKFLNFIKGLDENAKDVEIDIETL